jgi:YggT family protein
MTAVAALVVADARSQIADYVLALGSVYTILIFAYVVASLIFSFGMRVPYSRPLNAVLEFLRQVCEPYLRLFRRFLPMVGPLDLSPLVAVIVLQLVTRIVTDLIAG